MARFNANRTESLTVPISLHGQQFDFQLLTRPLDLGTGIPIQYYWMNSSQFRKSKAASSSATIQTILGHWWAAMQASGWADELDQQIHYVAAGCYPLVATAKSLQDVYKDAYLAAGRTNPTSESLPDDVRERIRRVIAQRDSDLVRAELDRVLGRFDPPTHVMPLLQEAFRRWIGRGVSEFRRHGPSGLVGFRQEIEVWMIRYRKKGGNYWVRQFINMFSYECKVSFFTCYANCWTDLIPWLRQNRRLDANSERFLLLWHNQNNSGERRSDVFSGQVLSLHPLSGFFMQDPALLAVAGQYFTTPAYEPAEPGGLVKLGPAYWNLIGAIISAAYLYRSALDRQGLERGARKAVPTGEYLASGSSDDGISELREFLAGLELSCPHCPGELDYRLFTPASADAVDFDAHFTCKACRRPVTHRIKTDDLLRWLRQDD